MRSLIIIEVEHGEETDALQAMAEDAVQAMAEDFVSDPDYFGNGSAMITNYTVRVDLPANFVLDSPVRGSIDNL